MLPSRGAMLLLCTYHGGLNVATLRHEACYWLDHQKKTKDKRHRTRNLMQPSHLWTGKLQYITFSWIVGIYQPTNIQQCTSLFCQMPDLSDNQAGLGLNLWQHMIRCYNFIVFFFFFFLLQMHLSSLPNKKPAIYFLYAASCCCLFKA